MSELLVEEKDILAKAAEAKAKGDADKRWDELDGALAAYERAVHALHSFNEKLTINGSGEANEIQQRIRPKLADFLGMCGGVLRRIGDLPRAEARYREGGVIENEMKLKSTYNRVNRLVLELLREPALIQERKSEITEVKERLIEATKDSGRYWSWADRGLITLLDLEQSDEDRLADAKEAYIGFGDAGASLDNYDSSIEVLNALAATMATHDPAIERPIREIVQFLEDQADMI